MKMSLSGWFQRGAKKLRGNPVPQAVSHATTATIAWVDRRGVPQAARATLGERFEGGIDLGLAEEIAVDTPLWLLSEDGFDRVASVHFCGVENGYYTVRVGFLDDASSDAEGATASSRMKWIGSGNRVVACPVSFRNGEAGRLTVTMTEAVPAPCAVLLTGGGYQCLGAVQSCEEESDCWMAEVQVLSEAYPRPGLQAA